MIQDIYHHKMEVVYDGEAVLGENDYIIAFQGRNVYMKKQKDETSGAFLTCEDILPVEYRKEAMEKFRRDAIYLLCLDGRRLFLLPEKYLSSCPQAQQKDINIFREKNEEGRPVSFAMITAWHLYRWYEETKFCGACGVRLRHGKEERTMVCPICGKQKKT